MKKTLSLIILLSTICFSLNAQVRIGATAATSFKFADDSEHIKGINSLGITAFVPVYKGIELNSSFTTGAYYFDENYDFMKLTNLIFSIGPGYNYSFNEKLSLGGYLVFGYNFVRILHKLPLSISDGYTDETDLHFFLISPMITFEYKPIKNLSLGIFTKYDFFCGEDPAGFDKPVSIGLNILYCF